MSSDNRLSNSSVPPQPYNTPINRNFEFVAKAALERGQEYQSLIRALESKLASDLSNSRATNTLLDQALSSLDANRKRVDRALTRHIPHIYQELRDSMDSLLDLEDRLPEIHAQVKTICAVYDSGRITATELTADLEWKHASLQDKCRRIVFTRTSPVSWLEAAAMRIAFCFVFLLFVWQLLGALDGAYRAYRHRLVWGDKLMS